MFSDFSKAITALAVTLVAGALIDYRVGPSSARPLPLDSAFARTLTVDGQAGDRAATLQAVEWKVDPSTAAGQTAGTTLRVCADPNNLPFSNERRKGFENALAKLVAKDLGRTLTYTWWPQRRGFVRNTLRAGECDVVMGVPSDYDLVLPTAPYYRSTYVFVTRRDRGLHIQSLDDPKLRHLTIGVFANVPPAHALAVRDLQSNIRGYSIYGNYDDPNPPRALIDAVAHREVDVAIAWGPLAGYFAEREPVALALSPVPTPAGQPTWPMTYAISMGVRRNDTHLRAVLDAELARRRPEIERLLASFGVPLVEPNGQVRTPADIAE